MYMRTKGTAAELELRRRIGGRLLLQGRKLWEVAEACDVNISSVKRWKAVVGKGGLEALAAQGSPGREPKLDEARKAELMEILLAGPVSAGYHNELWTRARVAHAIESRFGIKYHPTHVGRILRNLGFSCQKPEQKAREQNDDEVAHWRRYKWPALKRGLANIS
jgi:transposase